MPVPHHSVFTGRMPFLPPNQQRQSTVTADDLIGALDTTTAIQGMPVIS